MGSLHAEWTKLRTLPGTIWLLAGTAVLTVAVSTAAAAATRCPRGLACPVDPAKLSLTGVQFGQAVVAIVAVLAGVAGSLLAGRLLLPSHGLAFGPDGPMLRAAAGSVLYLALIGLLALGIGTAVRDTAVAIGAVLGLLYLFPVVAAVAANPHWQRHLEQAGPMTAGLEIEATRNLHSLPVSPWAGLATRSC